MIALQGTKFPLSFTAASNKYIAILSEKFIAKILNLWSPCFFDSSSYSTIMKDHFWVCAINDCINLFFGDIILDNLNFNFIIDYNRELFFVGHILVSSMSD